MRLRPEAVESEWVLVPDPEGKVKWPEKKLMRPGGVIER